MDIQERHPATEDFLRDIALCVATYRGSGPALVWPAGASAELTAYRARPPRVRPTPAGKQVSPALHAARGPMREWADRLGACLGEPVRARFWSLGAGQRTTAQPLERDAVLLQLAGACECRVSGGGPDETRPSDPVLTVRLRAGEALYLNRRSCYRLAEVHSHSAVVQFELDE